MKKIFVSLILIIALIFGVIAVKLAGTDFNKLYKNVLHSSDIDSDSLEYTEIEIHKFPIPYIVIKKIQQDKKFTLNDVKITFSLLSLITGEPKITDITVDSTQIEMGDKEITLLNHDKT